MKDRQLISKTIFIHSLTFKKIVDVVLIVVDPLEVVQVALIVTEPVLRDVDVPRSVVVSDPVHEGANAEGSDAHPG